jgi:CII-binding regulator of phage lambda lysogenization HflD
MTDVQLISIVLTLLAIFGSILYNRKGIEDMRDVLRAEIKASGAELRLELRDAIAPVNLALLRIENKLDHLTETQANHAERIERLERRG